MRLIAFFLVISVIASIFGCGSSSPTTNQETEDSSSPTVSSVHPAYLVGIWQWQWTEVGIIDHFVLQSDGSAERFKDTALTNAGGTWHVDTEGMLQVGFPKHNIRFTFRIDNEYSITDIETLPTDRDFPWLKVHKLTESLSRENVVSLPPY